ncbi:DUF4238 domain-containing protein [Escherichia coli]|uniref:DUF4238 domain-containing protein n=1 Tax=Escherichia coli TaxID=562 RepID=UPI00396E347E
MLPSETMIWQPEFTDKTLSRKPGAVQSYRQRNTKEIAEENYFYSIKMDDVVWDMLLYRYSDEIESNPYIRLLFNEFAILKEADIFVNKELLINNNDEKSMEFARKYLEDFNKIFLEDKYSQVESAISEIMKKIIREQESKIITPIDDKMFFSLLIFYSLQLFRTKKMMSKALEKIEGFILNRGGEEIVLDDSQKKTLLKCMLYITSFQFALRIEKECFAIKIYKNHTKINYITSDSPAIFYNDGSVAAMPLSPRLFVQFSLNKNIKEILPARIGFETIDIYNTEKIKRINKLIHDFSDDFLFAKKNVDLNFDF